MFSPVKVDVDHEVFVGTAAHQRNLEEFHWFLKGVTKQCFFYHGCDRPPPTVLPLPLLVLFIVLITVIVFWVILLDWFDPNSFLLEVHTCPLQVHLDTDVYWPTSDKNRGDQSIRLSVRVIMSTLEHSHSPERYNNHQTVENWGWVPLLYNSCESYFHNIFLRYYFLSIYRWAGAVVWYTHTNRYAEMYE